MTVGSVILVLTVIGLVAVVAFGYSRGVVPFVKGETRLTKRWPFIEGLKTSVVLENKHGLRNQLNSPGTERNVEEPESMAATGSRVDKDSPPVSNGESGAKRRAPSRNRKPISLPPLRIAVLPLIDDHLDPADNYLAVGMTGELISRLSVIDRFRVIALPSVMKFKGVRKSTGEIARELQVEKILEGRVGKAAGKLHFAVQLTDARTEEKLWSREYDRDLAEISTVHSDVVRQVAEKLKVTLARGERKTTNKKGTENLAAYNLYLKGRFHSNMNGEGALRKAIEYFERAVGVEPTFAPAYSGLATALNTLPDHGPFPPKEIYPRARKAALSALEIDDALAEAHASLARVSALYDWDRPRAEREFHRSLELNPGYATAHHWYGLYLMSNAQFDEAVAEIELALELDPFSLILNRNLGEVLLFAREYDRAIGALQKTIEMDPKFDHAHLHLARAYFLNWMYDDSLIEFQREKGLSKKWDPFLEIHTAMVHEKIGRRVKAHLTIQRAIERSAEIYVPPFLFAHYFFTAGANDLGFKWLKKACEERDDWLRILKIAPELDNIRSDLRYRELLKTMGWEDRSLAEHPHL